MTLELLIATASGTSEEKNASRKRSSVSTLSVWAPLFPSTLRCHLVSTLESHKAKRRQLIVLGEKHEYCKFQNFGKEGGICQFMKKQSFRTDPKTGCLLFYENSVVWVQDFLKNEENLLKTWKLL